MLRHQDDRRTLIWALLLFPAAGFAPYVWPGVIPWMLPLSLYLGFCAGVFSHNHNHCPTFKSRRLNAIYSAWLSIFYLFPTYVWILPAQDTSLASTALLGALHEALVGPLAPDNLDDPARMRDAVQTVTLLALRAVGVMDARARGLVVQAVVPPKALVGA